MSRSDIPEWVRVACSRWGRQKRRVWSGKDWHGNIDGYAQSLLGRIRDERDGTGQGARTQHWPEVFWGDGLDVQRSMIGIAHRSFCVLHFQYVWDPEWNITASTKAGFLDLKRTEYFEVLGKAETWVHARLEALPRSDSQVVEQVSEIVRQALNSGTASAIHSQTRPSCPSARQPDIDLAALNRSKLTVSR